MNRITKITSSAEKRKLRRLSRVLPLVLSAVTVDENNNRYITIYQRHDTCWFIGEEVFGVTNLISALSWRRIKLLKNMMSSGYAPPKTFLTTNWS